VQFLSVTPDNGISGAAGIAHTAALSLFFCRKPRAETRQGPALYHVYAECMHRASGQGVGVSGHGHGAKGTGQRAQGTEHRAWGIGHGAKGTEHRARSARTDSFKI
jgi:hypothetical protein